MDVVVMMLNLMQACIFRYEMMNSIKYCYLWCGDNSLSVHNDILVLGEGLKDGLDDTAITVEGKYSVNITKSRKENCLILHYSTANSFMLMV